VRTQTHDRFLGGSWLARVLLGFLQSQKESLVPTRQGPDVECTVGIQRIH